ncbi:MAG: branched-chain amino acid ABC transporter permease [Syntrophorhabdales bacterium]|jgi:branched-chain amino acid transport system permease protein
MTRNVYWLAWGIAIVLLLSIPYLLPEIWIHLAVEALVFSLFAVSFNLLFGYSGLLPFGHGALFGIGAYVVALILRNYPDAPLLLTFLLAALGGVIAAAVIGVFSVRLKGAYFALITTAFQMFAFAVAEKWRGVTNGDDGVTFSRPDLHLGGLAILSMKSIHHVYYLTLVIVGISILACWLFLKTPLGNSAVAVREKDVRASFLGYNVFLTRYTLFVISGVFAGLAGGLFAFFEEFVAASCLNLDTSMSVVFMTVIGGPANFLGPVLGSVVYIVFQDWISSLTRHWWILMGCFFVIVVLYLQSGLISLIKPEKVRLWLDRRRG